MSRRSRSRRSPAPDRAGDDGWTRLRRVRTRPTRRALVQTLLGLVLYGAGANVSAGWVVVLAAIVLGAVPWAWFSAWRAGGSIAVRRELPARAVAGVATPVHLHVRARTSAMAVVTDDLTGGVGVAAELHATATLAGRTTLARGQAVAGEVRAEVSDPFGLVTVRCAGEVPTATEVLPGVPRVSGAAPATAWVLHAGEASGRPGPGTELLGVREYRQGDPLRAVHWRSSARRGQLVVRELADDARPQIRIVLAETTWPVAALDRAAEVAAGLAEDAVRAGLPVAVAVDGVVEPWSPAARRLLAVVPPHAGAPARPLRPAPDGPADVVVDLRPAPGGVAVSIGDGTAPSWLGVVPDDADLPAVEAWFAARDGAASGGAG